MKLDMDVTEIAGTPEQVINNPEMPVSPDQWKGLDAEESGSVKRAVLYNEGYNAGYTSAVDDYLTGRVGLDYFEKLREARDITDFYAIGFEMGYFRKLAELLIL